VKEDRSQVLKCDICGGDIEQRKNDDGSVWWNEGHNAQPVSDGRACDACNTEKVIPARLGEIMGLMEPENARIIAENFDIVTEITRDVVKDEIKKRKKDKE
tara:strand:- start:84 stop:386 length:303 start_codon:yes stop_codon:yes gene_type:complete